MLREGESELEQVPDSGRWLKGRWCLGLCGFVEFRGGAEAVLRWLEVVGSDCSGSRWLVVVVVVVAVQGGWKWLEWFKTVERSRQELRGSDKG